MKKILLRFLTSILLIALVIAGLPATTDASSGTDPIRMYTTDDARVSAHLKFIDQLNRKHHKISRILNHAGFQLHSSNGLEGNPRFVTFYNAEADDWSLSERYMLNYDNDRITEELNQYINLQDGTWVNSYRTLFSHTNEQLERYTEQVYVSGNWVNEYDYQFSYETIGGQFILKSLTEFFWDGDVQEWVPETLFEVTYTNGALSKIETFEWLGSGWSEQPSDLTEIAQVGNDLYETFYEEWNGSGWDLMHRTIHLNTTAEEYYDIAIRLDYFIYLGSTNLLLEQLNLGNRVYQYNIDGDWINDTKVDLEFGYDNSGSVLLEKRWVNSEYNEFDESWFADSRNSLYLNTAGKFIGGAFSYNGGDEEDEEFWIDLIIETYSLNDQDLISEIIVEYDFGQILFPVMRSTIDYSGTPTSAETDLQRPTEVELLQNYPNPFNPSTTITYRINEPAAVRLEVFNMMGQRVAVLADGSLQAGSYTVSFDATGLSSGVYFYRLNTGTFTESKKIMLVK